MNNAFVHTEFMVYSTSFPTTFSATIIAYFLHILTTVECNQPELEGKYLPTVKQFFENKLVLVTKETDIKDYEIGILCQQMYI